ncbi:MAG: hypothetical protein PVJ39_21300 [Gammaproteobacteria bacterium]|jgi:hypothetical protein
MDRATKKIIGKAALSNKQPNISQGLLQAAQSVMATGHGRELLSWILSMLRFNDTVMTGNAYTYYNAGKSDASVELFGLLLRANKHSALDMLATSVERQLDSQQ